jgi:hypothetical protein
MPITQIPFQDPVAPEKTQPEQLGLYDSQDWESAYRDLDNRVPHLLIQLQDDLQRSRKREAAWISVIVHLLAFMLIVYLPWIQKNVWHHGVVIPVDSTQGQNLTMLTLPPDAQKLTRKPNTNIASDKDRIAMTRHPELDPKDLQKSLVSPPPGAPGMRGQQQPPQPLAQNQLYRRICRRGSHRRSSSRRVRSFRAISRPSCKHRLSLTILSANI